MLGIMISVSILFRKKFTISIFFTQKNVRTIIRPGKKKLEPPKPPPPSERKWEGGEGKRGRFRTKMSSCC